MLEKEESLCDENQDEVEDPFLRQPKFVIGQDLRDVLLFSIQPGLGYLKYGNMMLLKRPKGNMLQYEEHFMMEIRINNE